MVKKLLFIPWNFLRITYRMAILPLCNPPFALTLEAKLIINRIDLLT